MPLFGFARYRLASRKTHNNIYFFSVDKAQIDATHPTEKFYYYKIIYWWNNHGTEGVGGGGANVHVLCVQEVVIYFI